MKKEMRRFLETNGFFETSKQSGRSTSGRLLPKRRKKAERVS
jgi:hypothetical protein